MRSANIRYLPQVDHLRALAAVWVVLYHGVFVIGPALHPSRPMGMLHATPTPNPLRALLAEGHTAVALFMVLSGFILTVGSFGRAISYRDFILNRVLRIYPLYVAVLLFVLSDDRVTTSVAGLVAMLLPLADFKLDGNWPLIAMAWAVSVELQFYLLFPFLLRHLNRAPVKTTASVIGTALMFRVIGLALWVNSRDMAYYHLIGRIDQFVAGMFAATLFVRWSGRERVFRAVFCLALPAAVLLIWAFQSLGGGFDSEARWKVLWPTAEGCAWAAVVLGYAGMGQKLPVPLSKLIAMIGAMSFSIYLLHRVLLDAFAQRPWAQIRLTDQPELDALLTTALLVLPLTLAVSAVTYRVIEEPFLNLRRRYVAPAGAALGAAGQRHAPGVAVARLLGSDPMAVAESAVASAEPARPRRQLEPGNPPR